MCTHDRYELCWRAAAAREAGTLGATRSPLPVRSAARAAHAHRRKWISRQLVHLNCKNNVLSDLSDVLSETQARSEAPTLELWSTSSSTTQSQSTVTETTC